MTVLPRMTRNTQIFLKRGGFGPPFLYTSLFMEILCVFLMFSSLPLYNHQREVGEAPRGHHRRVARVELRRRTYVLEVVVRVLWMQGHAAVHFVGALRQLHDDHCSTVVHQPFQLLCGRRAGQDREPLFLAGYVQSCEGSCSDEGGDARHVFRRPSVGPQPLEDIVDGRIKSRVALRYDADVQPLVLQGTRFGIHAVVGLERRFSPFAHG